MMNVKPGLLELLLLKIKKVIFKQFGDSRSQAEKNDNLTDSKLGFILNPLIGGLKYILKLIGKLLLKIVRIVDTLFFPWRIFVSFKNNKKAAFRGTLSAIIPGLGQFRNKQWYKALPFLAVFLILIGIELGTGGYQFALSGELSEFPAGPDGRLFFFRDYGGYITKGIWGLLTLGEVTLLDNILGSGYRGAEVLKIDRILTWRSMDNSQTYLGLGVISFTILLVYLTVWYLNIKDAYHSYIAIEKNDGIVEEPKIFVRRIWDDFFAYIIIIPSFVLILFFTFIPFLFSFLVAFTNWTSNIQIGLQTFKWVGLDTFKLVFQNTEFLGFFGSVFIWTIFYAAMSSITVYIFGFIQAMIIESRYVKFKKFWRVILVVPWAVPALISLMLFRQVFNENVGLINTILANTGTTEVVKEFLRNIGLLGQTTPGVIAWLNDPLNSNLTRAIIIVVNLWLGFPYFMMLITGVLGTIPDSLYEAADIDGASGGQKFKFITLPWVLRATAPIIITTFTFNFNNFGAIYFLTGGGPGYSPGDIPNSVAVMGAAPGKTDILISWIYKLSFVGGVKNYNLAAVYSILIFVLISLTAIYTLSKQKAFWEED